MARILIVTPAGRGSRTGNRVTAVRWARMLRDLGHRVSVTTEYDGGPVDALVALHAKRSANAVAHYRCLRPHGKAVVVLTGTDLYRDLPECRPACATLDAADAIIILQGRARERLRAAWRAKAHVVHQSVRRVKAPAPRKRSFDVCVIGHLRDEKDPLRAARAAVALPAESRVKVVQVGGALTPEWFHRAEREVERNPRFEWRGERSRSEARRILARSRLMVLSSRMEGGANVIGEAVVNDVPILASRIEGNLGLLGEDHPGLFPVGDTDALASAIGRAETDTSFLMDLVEAGRRVAHLFTPEREQDELRAALQVTAHENPNEGA